VSAINGGSGTVGGSTAGNYGSLTLNADGTFSYAVDQGKASVLTLQRGQTLTETYTYTISDGHGGTSTATITFTIHGTNDQPYAGNDVNTIAEEQGTATGNVLSGQWTNGGGGSGTDTAAQDSDPNGDALTITDIMRPDGSGGSVGHPFDGLYGRLTLNADGSYSYALDNASAAVQKLKAGETVTDSFVYTTSDGRGSFVDATITIVISGVNDQPQARADSDAISEDSAVPATGNVLINDADPDAGSTLRVSAINGGSGTVGGATAGGYGRLTLNADGTYSYVLDNANPAVQALKPGQTLSEVFQYTVSDGQGGSATTTLTIVINGQNDWPTAVADNLSAREDGPAVNGDLTPAVTGQDSDVDGDSLTVIAFSNANGLAGGVGGGSTPGAPLAGLYGQLRVAEDGRLVYTPDNDNPVVQALAAGQSIKESFTYTISDGHGGFASSTLTITIDGTNDAPTTVGALPARHNNDGSTVAPLDVSGHFADADLGDTLTYTASGLPPGLHIDGNGVIRGTLDSSASTGGPGHNGVYSVVITATDGHGQQISLNFTWTASNPPPSATDNAYVTGSVGGPRVVGNALTDAVADSDPDGDALHAFVATVVPGSHGGLFSIAADGQVSFDPHGDFDDLVAGQTRQTSYVYTLVDADGATVSARIFVTVIGADDSPIAKPDHNSASPGTHQTGNVLDNDSDPDAGDSLTVSQFVVNGVVVPVSPGAAGGSTTIPGVGTLTVLADGGYTFLPAANWHGSVPPITYTVRDSTGLTATGTLSLEVLPPDISPPPPTWDSATNTPIRAPSAPIEPRADPIAQPFVPAEFVLRQVDHSASSLVEGVAKILDLQTVGDLGETQSSLLQRYERMTPTQFVLDQGVAYSRELVSEINRQGLALNDLMASDAESLNDDFSPFSPHHMGRQTVADDSQAPPVDGQALVNDDALPSLEHAVSPVILPDETPRPVAASFSEQLRHTQHQRRRIASTLPLDT